MKPLRWLVALFAVAVVASASESLTWMNDLAAAKAKAKAENKPLIVDFTGSTWCPPCKALHKTVLTSPQFAEFAKGAVLVALDYPPQSERTREKIAANPTLKKLMDLKAEYEVAGYPTVFYFDAKGTQRAKVLGYGGEPATEYIAKLQGK